MSVIDATSARIQRRREQRFAVDLAALLRDGAADVPVRLRDLSRGGALGTCPRPPAALSSVTLLRGALAIEARVTWTGPGCFGLEFARPIRATDLLIQLSMSRASLA